VEGFVFASDLKTTKKKQQTKGQVEITVCLDLKYKQKVQKSEH